MAEVKSITSKPSKLRVDNTDLFVITKAEYVVDDKGVVKGTTDGKAVTFGLYSEVDKGTYDKITDKDADSLTTSIEVPSGQNTTSTETKYYRRIAQLNEERNFETTSYTGAGLEKELANFNNKKNSQLTQVVENTANGILKAENITANSSLDNTNLTKGGADNIELTNSQNTTLPIENINVGTAKVREKYGDYFYPEDLRGNNQQDRIKFTMKKSLGGRINTEFGARTFSRTSSTGSITGSVVLPIQPSISDSNSVDWQGNNLNSLNAYLAGQSLNLMGSNSLSQAGSKAQTAFEDFFKGLSTSSNSYADALKLYLAQEAVGVQGLLSRASGAILNPNMELLFNAPSLRPFTFTFRLSPRSATEATQVKNIIRFFKQGMSVKTTKEGVFLKAPNTFDIRYISYDKNGNEIKNHPSLNRIKTCALTACDVNYTPDGTYMTFNDDKRTMTSYELSLRFTELDPVYDEDYTAIDSDPSGDGAANQIGY